ncbi:Alpha/Beta hydrolase protein [Massariosphaeria phaeospora]|uniref:Alpha/Beta hydrolase protein n=1 Tax=Massariosphaeria phaeospora TaxID=100035 RepID=A0A7C8I3B7_9PLEO|nr:Alpha/Beta hydrolase protein [Massariosphaeria phaeospora]
MVALQPSFAVAVGIACMLQTATTTPTAAAHDYDAETSPPASDETANTGSGFSALTPSYYPPNGHCTSFLIPLPLTYTAPSLFATPDAPPRWTSPFELQDVLATLTARAAANYTSPVGAPQTYSGRYDVAASFCTPRTVDGSGREKTVLLATHGIGPGRAHWNTPYRPEEYNFVQWALGRGYSVFFYDRVGCGASSRISGFESQLATAKTVLQSLATAIKAGAHTPGITAAKVVLLGFSFGSYATHAAIAETPAIADAVVLTAFSMNASAINLNGLVRSFVPRIAREENPALYGDRDEAYLTWPSVLDLVMNYFKLPSYSPSVALFTESAKQPFSIGEFLTFSSPASTDAAAWDKPALHLTGELDYIVCDGYCPGVFEEPARTLYKNARPLQLSLHPGASHHVFFHRNATGAFGVVTDFLERNGL